MPIKNPRQVLAKVEKVERIDTVVTTKLEVFSSTQRVEKLGRLDSIKAAGDAMMGDGR